MRIYELAKKLGVDAKELIVKLKSMNFPVKSHMSVIDEDTAVIISNEVADIERKEIAGNVIEVNFPITLKDLSVKLNKKSSEILGKCIKSGKFYTINQSLDEKTASEIALQYKVTLKKKPSKEEEIIGAETKELKERAPIVTLMGHIDHGKTSILDYIRKSRIAAKESGGITQHIGAYQVHLDKGIITFLDTPGHETFTAMRARGATATDIVIIVVAADEGVKPQTEEAIDHAKAAGVPLMVAINKIDKPNANVDLVKQQLSKFELVPEDWGGKTITVGVSAKTGEGIDGLLELILLQAELMEIKADYGRSGVGVVIEAKLSKGKGPVSSVLIQEGRVKVGDWCVCGHYCGRARALHDDHGKNVNVVMPAFPVEVLGLNGVPKPGDRFFVVPDEKTAKEIVAKRREEEEKQRLMPIKHLKLEDLYKKVKEENLKQLKIILKADVGGTLEAVETALGKIVSVEVELVIIHKGVGTINSSDVLLAEVSDAIIVGFKVDMGSAVRELAKQKAIEVRVYQIVYELIDDVKAALEGMLAPHIKRIFLGRAKVKAVFNLSKSGIVAGCMVDKGKILRGAICQITRGSEIVHEGKVQALKRFKDDVKEVAQGFECGISTAFKEVKVDDIIDTYNEEMITRRLEE